MSKQSDDYQQTLNALHFTSEQKSAMAAQVARAAQQKPHRPAPLFRTALIAAALASVMVVGAGASGVLRSVVETFSPILGGDAAQTEIMDKIGRPIGASISDHGVTITADAIIGDRYSACVVYSITRDDGTPFAPELLNGNEYGYLPIHFRSSWTDLPFSGGSHGASYFLDSNPDDNAIQFITAINADQPLNQGKATADFQDLCFRDPESGENVILVEGHWKLSFHINYEDSAVYPGSGETFQQNGVTFTIDELSVSPVAVQVRYHTDAKVPWTDPDGNQLDPTQRLKAERLLESIEIKLTKTDGTVLDLSNAGGGITTENGKTICFKGDLLETLVPLEEMSSISVGGIVYPLAAE